MLISIEDLDVRTVLVESLAFENANKECKNSRQPLKAQGTLLSGWIKATADIGSAVYNIALTGQGLANDFI